MINREIIESFTDDCKPRVLVVTDMWFSKENARFQGFSLSQFVDTLLKAGMEVTRANLLNRGGEPEGTLLGFKFDDPEDGLSRERYDVCFIFTFEFDKPRLFEMDPPPRQPRRQFGLPDLEDTELTAIKRFMEEGGGVFATGDHEDLGARTAKDIPRVRNMRNWLWERESNDPRNAPSGDGPDRLSTMLSGIDDVYEFADESDSYPQRVILNRNTVAGGIGMPHPLMQAQNGRAIVHIPDHPHEGECIIPQDLETEFQLDGEKREEWPSEIDGDNRVSPEIVAKSDSMGGPLEFPFDKPAPAQREFIAIAAYDGHRAGVGRVVTDATWHHFLDINIDGTGSRPRDREPRSGLQDSHGNDRPELVRLRQHWRNLAEWLMPPQDRRRCIALVRIADAASPGAPFPILLDELVSLTPDELGQQIKMNLDRERLPYQVNDLLETVLAMGISDPVKRKETEESVKLLALGALTAALFDLEPGTVDEMLEKLEEAVAATVENENV